MDLLVQHRASGSAYNILKYFQRFHSSLTVSDLLYFFHTSSQHHHKLSAHVISACAELMSSLPGDLLREQVFELLHLLGSVGKWKASPKLLLSSSQRIASVRVDVLGALNGKEIGVWLSTIFHLQAYLLETDLLVQRLSQQLQFTIGGHSLTNPTSLVSHGESIIRSLSPQIVTREANQCISVTLMRDLAHLLPFCDLSLLTGHEVAQALPHLYLSYNEMCSGHHRLILRTLLPHLLPNPSERGPGPAHASLTPSEITNVLSSMRHTNWLAPLEYDLLAHLASEMTAHARAPLDDDDAPFYSLSSLCTSLLSLRSQYIDSPQIESLLHAIALLLSRFLVTNPSSGELEVRGSLVVSDADLGTALYGLSRMSNNHCSSSLSELLSVLIPFFKASPCTFTGHTLGSCLQGISTMACDEGEVCKIISLLSDRLEARQEPLTSTTISNIINSLDHKTLAFASVRRLTEILLQKIEEHGPFASFAFTPEQVLQMIIGVRHFDYSHPLTKRLHHHIIQWIRQLNDQPSRMDAERFSHLLSLMGFISSGTDLVRGWLRYLRAQIRTRAGADGRRSVDPSSPCYRLSPSQTVRCLESLKGLNSQHSEVQKFIRDLTVAVFQNPDLRLTDTELTKCYLILQPMDKECREMKNLLKVLHLKRDLLLQEELKEAEAKEKQGHLGEAAGEEEVGQRGREKIKRRK
jgi:hypothetical protein